MEFLLNVFFCVILFVCLWFFKNTMIILIPNLWILLWAVEFNFEKFAPFELTAQWEPKKKTKNKYAGNHIIFDKNIIYVCWNLNDHDKLVAVSPYNTRSSNILC